MEKAMNIVFGIGIAILLYMVVLLGINAFYPEPDMDDYDCKYPEPKALGLCTDDMTVAECNSLRGLETIEDRGEYDSCYQEFQDARDLYNKNFFLITNIIGLVFVVSSIYFSSMMNISVGTASAGLALIVFGFIIGWQSTNDILKFVIGLIMASIVIFIAVKIHGKEQKPSRKRKRK
jgi:hypothetical protein